MSANFAARLAPPNADGCRLWLGPVTRNGYGTIGFRGKTTGVHRFAWTLAFGPIPDGLHVLHRCDVRACGAVEHLYLGTNRDNVRDRVTRHRSRHLNGSRNSQARLTEYDIPWMEAFRGMGLGWARIGQAFGVSKTTAKRAILGINWPKAPRLRDLAALVAPTDAEGK